MRPAFRFLPLLVSLVVFLLVIPPPAHAPTPPLCNGTCEPDPGSPTYGPTFTARSKSHNIRGTSVSIHASASTATGTLPGSESYNYAVPILSLPGRNGLDLNLALFYNSRLWTIDKVNSTATFNADRDYPGYGFRIGFGYIEVKDGVYLLTEPDGSKRPFRFVSGSTYETSDSSYIDYNTSTMILRRKDGAQWEYEQAGSSTIYRPKKIKDTNGNFLSIAYVAGKDQEISTITDTLGRVLTFNYDANGKLTSISQGGATHVNITWGQVPLNYAFTLTPQDSPTSGTNINVITACRYPNSTGYDFVYGDWGIIKEIKQVSSNGTQRSKVTYNYPLASAGALSDHPTYNTQTVDDGDGSPSNWTYAVTKSGGLVSAFEVTDPSLTKTTTNLDTSGTWQTGLPSSVTIKNSGGTVLRTVAYTWAQENATVNNPRVTSVTTTLNDTGSQQSKVQFTYTTYGNVSWVQEYDYGLLLRRQTNITYQTGSNYTSLHILDRPTQVKVYQGTNPLLSRTDFAYDSTTLTSVTGAANHDDANYGSGFTTRGNVTTVTRYANAAAGTGAVTRNFYYDSLGNLTKADLDCCQLKQWVFTFTTQYAYPTTITTGPTAGPQLTVSRTYDFATGRVLTATDENNKQTTLAYDNMDRLTTITRPDGAELTTSFDDASLSPKVTSTTPIDATNNLVQVVTTDGLGRPLKQETKSGGGGTYSIVDTQYDTSGRPTQVSNPYTGSPTAWTTYVYNDPLGRVTQVTPPGGQGASPYAYDCPSTAPGTAVRVTDPAGKERCTYTDALGRLTRVDEPGYADGASGAGYVNILGNAATKKVWDPEQGMFIWVTNSGTITVTVGGFTAIGSGNGHSVIATQLRDQFNNNAFSPVSATTSAISGGTRLNLVAREEGLHTNFSLYADASWNTEYFTSPSITATPSGSTLTGGADGTTGTPSLDTPLVTLYTYDALDNLTQVLQGAQTRSFAYDSMSRLTSATTPEAGTVTYQYNSFSLVSSRTDARGVVVTYSYDGLNRLSGVSYNVSGAPGVSATSAVNFSYGTSAASNNNGRLVTMTDGTGSESYAYDELGRITQLTKNLDSTNYLLGYAYNYAGELTSITYPSGRVVSQLYDAIGRVNQISSGGTNYLSSVTYNAAHQPESFNYGNGVVADPAYNSRLQLASLTYTKNTTKLLDLAYSYTSATHTGNNGQITKVQDTTGTPEAGRTADYTYDAWSRLKTAVTTGSANHPQWGLSWDYDRYGNRKNQNVTAGSAPAPQLAISPTTNRITSTGYAYDASGNLTNDAVYNYTYDAENRIIQAKQGTTVLSTSTYDGGALRVKKVAGSNTTRYIFSGTMVIAEYLNGSLNKEYVYSGSQLLATLSSSGTPTYHHPDHLSNRVNTDSSGNVARTFGHYPFGEIWYETGTADKWKFTSYERDSDSGLDYAMFRYYSPRLGRFMQADLLEGTILDPQTLNLYSYVSNDPLNWIDPLGLLKCFVDGYEEPCEIAIGLLRMGAAYLGAPEGSGWRADPNEDGCYSNNSLDQKWCADPDVTDLLFFWSPGRGNPLPESFRTQRGMNEMAACGPSTGRPCPALPLPNATLLPTKLPILNMDLYWACVADEFRREGALLFSGGVALTTFIAKRGHPISGTVLTGTAMIGWSTKTRIKCERWATR